MNCKFSVSDLIIILLLINFYRLAQWVDSSGGTVPSNAVSGGHEADGHTLYVARAPHDGHVIPGKVRQKLLLCS